MGKVILVSSSHSDWMKKVIETHHKDKPFAPENGQQLKFKVGDKVVYTNANGVQFVFKVTGYYKPDELDAHYALGRRYLLDWDCPWFPVAEASLNKV